MNEYDSWKNQIPEDDWDEELTEDEKESHADDMED